MNSMKVFEIASGVVRTIDYLVRCSAATSTNLISSVERVNGPAKSIEYASNTPILEDFINL